MNSQLDFSLYSYLNMISLFPLWLHGGTVFGSLALQQEGPVSKYQHGVFLHGVCNISPFMCGFAPGILVSTV